MTSKDMYSRRNTKRALLAVASTTELSGYFCKVQFEFNEIILPVAEAIFGIKL